MAKKQLENPVPVICVREGSLEAVGLDARASAWAAANGFSGQAGKLLTVPDADGNRSAYLFGMGDTEAAPAVVTGLASAALEPGDYRLEGDFGDPTLAALGFLLGAYRYDRYKSPNGAITLEAVEGADMAEARRLAGAAFIARDLVNTPPNDLGPVAFEKEIQKFAKARDMSFHTIVGDALLEHNFPMVHAVGRASAEAPRLVELFWGRESDPKITLVGKGVTFDTGGLDIKPPAGMLLMKKDMGGAANVLGLAHAIVDAKLRVRLRVIIPIVENAISGASFRPGDVLKSRKGLTVEIGNTDAEGRLILADALTLADEAEPELIVDMATLTGAARTALGPDLPPLYTHNDTLAEALVSAGAAWDDPLWRMPLWAPYQKTLSSRIADINHISSGPFAGSITAALFLSKFVEKAKDWVHFDIFAWAPEARPGRPMGGTDQAMRAVYAYFKDKYPAK